MNGADSVTYLGHATARIDLEGVRLLTDPVLRGRIGPLVRHGPSPSSEESARIDAILISHLHHDHADLPSLRQLGRDVPMLVPPGSGGFFGRHRFRAVAELAPGDSRRIGPVTVTAVEARHPGGRRFRARRPRAVGFLVEGRRRVYFAGDTGYFEGIAELPRGLDLALLPIWGWGPSIGPEHLDPEAAARVAALLSPRVVVPVHWGTLYPFGLSRLRGGRLRGPGPEFAALMRELAPQVETRVLSPGETLSLA